MKTCNTETLVCLFLAAFVTYIQCQKLFKPKHVEDPAYWRKIGQEDLEQSLKLSQTHNTGVARNVILGIGDGMGISTVTAARIHEGQTRGESGEENYLTFERFPYAALLKTYSVSKQVADSASTAFSLLSGIKTNSGVMGHGSEAKRNICEPITLTEPAYHPKVIDTILDWSLAAGKSVGIVTTDQLTGGTPAAAFAHTAERDWRSDRETPPPCRDIAKQLIEDNPNIHVLLGGGRQHFGPLNATHGRLDGRDLIKEWKNDKEQRDLKHRFVSTAKELETVNAEKVDYLFGIFDEDKIPFIHNREQVHPTLIQMVRKAVEILSKNKNGFFLLVEGSNIDSAHHKNKAGIALREVVEFDRAISVIIKMTDDSETFVAVTADHSHVFTISGYPLRGNPIFSFTYGLKWALDGKRTATLGYRNGPGWKGRKRPLITAKQLENIEFQYTGGRPSSSESHGGEDVALYARGPMSHLFHGVHEQSYVAHVMSYASCVGNMTRVCPSASAIQIVAIPKSCILFSMLALVVMFKA